MIPDSASLMMKFYGKPIVIRWPSDITARQMVNVEIELEY